MENGRAVDGDEEPLMLMPGNVRHGPLRREAALHTIFIFLFFSCKSLHADSSTSGSVTCNK